MTTWILLFFIRAGSRVQNSPQRCHRHRKLDAICECEVGKNLAADKWFIIAVTAKRLWKMRSAVRKTRTMCVCSGWRMGSLWPLKDGQPLTSGGHHTISADGICHTLANAPSRPRSWRRSWLSPKSRSVAGDQSVFDCIVFCSFTLKSVI